MQIYEYRCRTCGHTETSTTRADTLGACPTFWGGIGDSSNLWCDGELRRVFAVNVNRPMQEHMNKYVNQPVSSMRQFEDILKKKSEESEASTGIPCRYAPVDPKDLIKPVAPPPEKKPEKPHTRVFKPFPVSAS